MVRSVPIIAKFPSSNSKMSGQLTAPELPRADGGIPTRLPTADAGKAPLMFCRDDTIVVSTLRINHGAKFRPTRKGYHLPFRVYSPKRCLVATRYDGVGTRTCGRLWPSCAPDCERVAGLRSPLLDRPRPPRELPVSVHRTVTISGSMIHSVLPSRGAPAADLVEESSCVS
jgi:hypothetical protein